jgi:hypothetical protein
MPKPRGINVAGTIKATFSAEVANPKKKKPKTIVLGNIMIIPAIFSLVRSASNERNVIKHPPTTNETTNCINKREVILNYNEGTLSCMTANSYKSIRIAPQKKPAKFK